MVKRLVIILFLLGVFAVSAAELSGALVGDRTLPVSEVLDEAAMRRAAAYASFGAGFHASNVAGEAEMASVSKETMEKYIAALAYVDDLLPVYESLGYLLLKKDAALNIDDYYSRIKEVLLSRKDAPCAMLCLASLELDRKDLDAAQPLLQPYLSAGGDQTVQALQMLASFFLQTKRYDELSVLVSQIERTPEQRDRKEFFVLRLCSHIRSGHRGQALALAPTVVEDPYTYDRLEWLNELAEALEQFGNVELEDAFVENLVICFDDRMQQKERVQMLQARMAKALNAKKHLCVDRAVAMIVDMPDLPDDFVRDCLAAVATAFANASDGSEAQRVYGDSFARLILEDIRRRPESEDAHLKELVVLYRILHRFDEAAEVLRRIPKVAMDEKLCFNALIVFCAAGDAEKAMEQHGLLRSFLREGRKLPGDVQGMVAQAMIDAGRMEEALQIMEEELRDYPEAPSALNGLGYTLADMDRDLDRAEKLIVKAIQAAPDESAFLDSLAWVAFRQGENLLALETMIDCLEHTPAQAWTVSGMAEILSHLREILLACDETTAAECFAPAAEK